MTTIQAYGAVADSLAQGLIKFNEHDFNLILLGEGYTPSINTHQFVDDLTDEVSGDGYTAGGKQLEGVSASYDNGVLTFDADDVSWDEVSLEGIRYGAIADVSADYPEDQPLVALVDFEEEQSTGEGGNFTVAWHSDGIVTIEVNPE